MRVLAVIAPSGDVPLNVLHRMGLTAYDGGSDCIIRLNGIFAFAVWDRRRKITFVARDRFLEKALFST